MGQCSRRIGLLMLAIAGCGASPMGGRGGELGVFDVPDAGQTATRQSPAANDGSDDSQTGLVAAGGVDSELRAGITAPSGLTLDVLTVACAGDCADVVAEAHGGNPPYQVKWGDGSTSAMRHVCPERDGELNVEVTDSALSTAEFNYPAHTAVATVTTKVLDCSDSDAGTAADGGTTTSWCVQDSITLDAASGCQPLTRTPFVCTTLLTESLLTNYDYAYYELPFPLQPDTRSCLVAFGNVSSTNGGLSFRVIAAANDCSVASQVWGVGTGGATTPPPANSDADHGRVLCLDGVSTTFTQLVASPDDPAPSTLGDLDLRICEQCPNAR